MKKHKKKKALQDIRQKRLFCAFSDINYSFAEWYQATQLEIDRMEQELSGCLLPNHL
ncbi:MAG: hypothetical protein J6V32_01970 [Elusimicrobiaceae bacterium]|nr:hypothetical protein [Elusimicrobiaceae bacterium]